MSSDFEKFYLDVLKQLSDSNPNDHALRELNFVEEARENSGSDEYTPEWLRPYTAISSSLIQRGLPDAPEGLNSLIGDALLRAAQLGYTEGYFAGKDD